MNVFTISITLAVEKGCTNIKETDMNPQSKSDGKINVEMKLFY